MPNIAHLLKTEISRLARKESKAEIETLKKTVSSHRSEIAVLKRQLRELEKRVNALAKGQRAARPAAVAEAAEEEDGTGLRFRAAGLATNRKRLGLSAADFGLLVGTTGQSIYAWESGRTQPRAKHLAAIAALRGAGKKEVAAKLEALRKAR